MSSVTCQGVDTSDNGCRCTGTTIDSPVSIITLVGIIDGNARIGVSDGRDIRDGSMIAKTLRLPRWLADITTTATARAAPCAFIPTTSVICRTQCRSTNGNHGTICCRYLNTITTIARAGSDGDAWMIII